MQACQIEDGDDSDGVIGFGSTYYPAMLPLLVILGLTLTDCLWL